MKTVLALIIIGLTAFLGIAHAQEIPLELAQVRDPYLKTVTAIHATADARTKPIVASYVSALERLEKQFANDPATAGQITQERERLTAGTVATNEERAKMGAQLQQLRARYDADMQKTKAPFVAQEIRYARQYLGSLDALERRYNARNLLQDAAAVRTEIQRVNVSIGLKPEPDKKGHPIADSTISAGTAKAQGSLDAGLADKIAAAASAKTLVRTLPWPASATQGGTNDSPEGGGLLVGFEFYQRGPEHWIQSLRPYFLTKEGIVAGKDRGNVKKVTNKVMARPGYAVAGVLITEEKEIQVVFMKINPATGRFLTDAGSTYKSEKVGQKSKTKQQLIGGDGRLVVGVYGRTGANAVDLGLILLDSAK